MDLSVGVASAGSVYDEVLLEMLDHQGVTYEMVDGKTEPSSFPLVIVSKHTEEAYSVARRASRSESDVLVAEKAVDLDEAISLLQGELSNRGDDFQARLNNEEETLVSLIKGHFFGRGLPFTRKWFWPGMSPVGCVLTHDVDWFSYSPFHKQVLKQSANPLRLLRLLFGSLSGRDYGWNIPEMAEAESEYGFRSTFFFQTDYGPHGRLKESVAILKRGSFELALHGAHSSHKDEESLERELAAFRENTGDGARGLRYHILKFEAPRTWEIEAAAGLAYDATYYYNELFGFRAGTCLPYHPFSKGRRLPIVELPTSFMDWTALHKGLTAREQAEAFERSIGAVESHNGVYVANLHNTYMNGETFPAMYGTFRSLLETARSRRYWVATAYDCARWWDARVGARVAPRLESGIVTCSRSLVDVTVEREGRALEVIPANSAVAQTVNGRA